ncbi:MAG: hypothetical protein LBM77_12630 [Spirochaetaceae bacterium]|jgi:tetratricopeptide (TPR) repeat protein|nr:hypothetical protein [Spirochaetaceae bacterium]
MPILLMMKKLFFVWSLAFFLCLHGFAATPGDWWWTLEQGKSAFRNGAYGHALALFEEAENARRGQFRQYLEIMHSLLSTDGVRMLNNSLPALEGYIKANNLVDAQDVLNQLYFRIPRDTFTNSLEILKALEHLGNYPEAEYWIGEVYRVEGEAHLATRQYNKALANKDLVQSSDFDLAVRYKIADTADAAGDRAQEEETLLTILNSTDAEGNVRGALFVSGENDYLRTGMMNVLEKDGIDRFLTVYRYANPQMLKAHRMLADLYYAEQKYGEAAEHYLFSFLIISTIALSEMEKTDVDWTFSTLDNFIATVSQMANTQTGKRILSWLEENKYREVEALLFDCFDKIDRPIAQNQSNS